MNAPGRAPSPRFSFEDPAFVAAYEDWYDTVGRRADRLEKALLAKMLRRFPEARSVLEVGCGTGHFTRWLAGRGLEAFGVDLSPAMLAEAARLGTRRCAQGDARKLPFATGSFDLVLLITTLEFAGDPVVVLREALRVARRGLLLGVLNRASRLGRRLRRERKPLRLFTTKELTRSVELALAGRPARVSCRTTLWPLWPRDLPLPWGGLIGIVVRLDPHEVRP